MTPLQRKKVPPVCWPPDDQHARGWMDAIGVRCVSNLGAILHRLRGPVYEDHFGILMYHRIADTVPGLPQPTINVTPGQFRQQIQGLLARGFVFWPLSKVLEFRRRGWTVFPWVTVITFDDGFQSVYHHAWPVLEQLKVPATVFLSTAYLDGNQPFPFDHWAREHADLAPPESYLPLTVAQCAEMARGGLIELGAHTHTHQDFRGRPDELSRDLATNLAFLQKHFQVSKPTFAFPYGTPWMGFASEELAAAAREAGVGCGLTTQSCSIGPDKSPFEWGRIHAFPWDDGGTLAAKLGGWYGWAPRLRQRLRRGAPARRPQAAASSLGERARTAPAEKPLISVIVPTYNRAAWLADALQSLTAQRTDGRFDFEIVVVDNRSIDNTQKVCQRVSATSADVTVAYYQQLEPGDAPTRNCGCEQARGQWLAFFDDDQLAESTWLLELYDAAVETESQVVGGAVHLDLDHDQLCRLGFTCRRLLRETKLYSRVRPYARRHLPGTGNALVARSVVDKIGLFDESLSNGGSDYEFFARARAQGFQLVYTPHAVIKHRVSPGRLSAEYFRWEALSGGSEHAFHFDYQQHGATGLLLLCLARLACGMAFHLPLMVVVWLLGNPGAVLGRKTRLWRIEGHARKTLSILAPQFFPQRRFFESLEFRQGRSLSGEG